MELIPDNNKKIIDFYISILFFFCSNVREGGPRVLTLVFFVCFFCSNVGEGRYCLGIYEVKYGVALVRYGRD